MTATEFNRKLDSNGRLVIPIKLREKLHLKAGEVYKFFTHEEAGKTFLCIECPSDPSEVDNALKILLKNGYSLEETE